MSSQIIEKIDEFGTAVLDLRKTAGKQFDSLRERIELLETQGERPRGAQHESVETKAHFSAFCSWVKDPMNESRKAALAQAEADLEKKDVTTLTGAAGGFAVPKIISDSIEMRVRQLNPFRGLVSVRQAASADYHALVSMGDGTGGWVAENATRTATNSPTLRDRQPTVGTAYALPTATEESLNDIFFDVGRWLTEDASDEFASMEATAIISGNGSNRPTGILNTAPTAADDDASPLRGADVLEYIPGGAASDITSGDGLVDLAVGAIKEKYLLDTQSVAWVMHRSTLAKVRKLKATGSGDYIFSPSMVAGVAGTLLGYPVYTCDAMPTVATNAHAIAFGNWKRGYLLIDVGRLAITVDPYSTPGKVRFYLRRRIGGRILNNDAIKVLKVATA